MSWIFNEYQRVICVNWVRHKMNMSRIEEDVVDALSLIKLCSTPFLRKILWIRYI
jgi:hypothetical protein